MTSRYSLVMRSYPKDYRAEHGDELVDTANELTEGWSHRQSRALLLAGLRTRARLATNGSARSAVASGVAMALGVTIASSVGFSVVWVTETGQYSQELELAKAAMGALVLLALTIRSRWPTALLATVWLVVGYVLAIRSEEAFVGLPLVPVALIMAFMWLASRTDGPRAFSPVIGLLLVGLQALLLAIVSPYFYWVVSVVPLLLLLLFGVANSLIDPRSLVAGALLLFIAIVGWLSFVTTEFSPLHGDSVPEFVLTVAVSTVVLVGLVFLSRSSLRRFSAGWV